MFSHTLMRPRHFWTVRYCIISSSLCVAYFMTLLLCNIVPYNFLSHGVSEDLSAWDYGQLKCTCIYGRRYSQKGCIFSFLPTMIVLQCRIFHVLWFDYFIHCALQTHTTFKFLLWIAPLTSQPQTMLASHQNQFWTFRATRLCTKGCSIQWKIKGRQKTRRERWNFWCQFKYLL